MDATSLCTVQDTDPDCVISFHGSLRKLIARELEALQRFPKGYTSPVLLFENSKQGVAVHLRGARALNHFEPNSFVSVNCATRGMLEWPVLVGGHRRGSAVS